MEEILTWLFLVVWGFGWGYLVAKYIAKADGRKQEEIWLNDLKEIKKAYKF